MDQRLARLALVGAIIGSLLVVAPAATAQDSCGTYTQLKDGGDPNRPDPDDYGFIVITPEGHVTVNEEQALPWATAFVLYYVGLPGYVVCRTGTGGALDCAFAIAGKAVEIVTSMDPENLHFRYVYRDEQGWHLAGDQLIADARVANCLMPL
ncbi:MAG: hypothetical protein M3323_09295 [Actinomycetota bacterium]|nr:hypothetical protein [Actinomycetota bacterium]